MSGLATRNARGVGNIRKTTLQMSWRPRWRSIQCRSLTTHFYILAVLQQILDPLLPATEVYPNGYHFTHSVLPPLARSRLYPSSNIPVRRTIEPYNRRAKFQNCRPWLPLLLLLLAFQYRHQLRLLAYGSRTGSSRTLSADVSAPTCSCCYCVTHTLQFG